nr:unnamed protein product [Callosobruchus analis]
MVHEIGHVLGLGHSNVKSAIMYPWYQDKVRGLDIDDKNAIVQLYRHHGALNPSKYRKMAEARVVLFAFKKIYDQLIYAKQFNDKLKIKRNKKM